MLKDDLFEKMRQRLQLSLKVGWNKLYATLVDDNGDGYMVSGYHET